MPLVLVETRKQHSIAEEIGILNAINESIIQSFKTTTNDNIIRLISHEPHRFCCPIDIGNPELYTLITIDAFSGRPQEVKNLLFTLIFDNLEKAGIPKECVKILFRETPKENWSLRLSN